MEAMADSEIGRYKLLDVRGKGGVGVVHRALDQDLDRIVALKLIDPRLGPDEKVLGRFALESELAQVLEHPNVMPIYETGEHEGLLYIAMPLIEGPSLKELIAKEGPLAPRRAWGIVAQIADALDAAHEAGVVHRDVKPQNVLIHSTERREHALLTDFGLVKRIALEAQLTDTDQLLGTLHYVAPEQIEGSPMDGRGDVYSLGCVLFECLTGAVPYIGETGYALLWAHVNAPPPRVSEKRPHLGEAIDLVIGKALAKSPAERHLTAGDLAEDARRALSLPRRRPTPGARAFEPAAARATRDVWARPPGRMPVLTSGAVPSAKRSRRWGLGPMLVAMVLIAAAIPLARSDGEPPSGAERLNVDGGAVSLGDPASGGADSATTVADVREARNRSHNRGTGERSSGSGPVGTFPAVADDPIAAAGSDTAVDPSGVRHVDGINGKIAYSHGGEIFVARSDGTQAVNMTANQDGFAYWPRWSPDGRRIAYHVDGLWVMGADGSHRRFVGSGFRPDWSPEGNRIVFQDLGTRNGWDLFVMDADGTDRRTLVSGPLDEHTPVWSPDGTQVAYVRAEHYSGHSDIYLTDIDGSDQRDLASGPLAEIEPDWSPDGSEVAFSGLTEDNTYEIFTIDRDRRNLTRLTSTPKGAIQPQWSPDGTKVLYIDILNADAWQLHGMNSDGTGDRLLIPENGIRQVPSWQPRCTVKGTAASDHLIGTSGPDLICGGGGDDVIIGAGGDDQIFGGPGDDRLVGGAGNDLLSGEAGNDVLLGGAGNDLLSGGPGKDAFYGGRGGDHCFDARDSETRRCD